MRASSAAACSGGTRPDATMSISSSIRTSAPARRSGPTIASSSRSTAPGSNERRSASLPPAATIARSGRNASAGASWRARTSAASRLRRPRLSTREAGRRRAQRLGDAVDPREVAVAGERLAHALGDAVAEHREAPPAARRCSSAASRGRGGPGGRAGRSSGLLRDGVKKHDRSYFVPQNERSCYFLRAMPPPRTSRRSPAPSPPPTTRPTAAAAAATARASRSCRRPPTSPPSRGSRA